MKKRRGFNQFVKWCRDKSKTVKSSKTYYRNGRPYKFKRVGGAVLVRSPSGAVYMVTKYYFMDSKGRVWYYY